MILVTTRGSTVEEEFQWNNGVEFLVLVPSTGSSHTANCLELYSQAGVISMGP